MHPRPAQDHDDVGGPSAVTRIAVVGAGPSALYATQALLRSRRALEITLYEAGAAAGVGVPYNPAHTDRTMLANIASVEIPPLGETLENWLKARSDAELARLGVERAAIDERAFFPRVTLGAYFAARLEAMIRQAEAQGARVRVLTRRVVLDVAPLASGRIRVTSRDAQGRVGAHEVGAHEVATQEHDDVLLATGHRAAARRARGEAPAPAPLREAYAASAAGDLSGEIGVLGTSLSAIDVAAATAARYGAFLRDEEGTLVYRPAEGAPTFRLTLMSRRGVLPEADFYCPIPYLPLRVLTAGAMQAQIAQGPAGLLDRAFALLRGELQEADPAYARAIGLDGLDADAFAKAYFAPRAAADPFDWARANLAEVKANAAARRTVEWRYAILRAHEVFALAVPHLDATDRRRFHRGLKGVFVDNYAAIPPESIERLLALRAAGRIELRRLGRDYAIDVDASGCPTVRVGARAQRFDHLVDARGQSALGLDDLPFPSLRLALKANRLARTQRGDLDEEAGDAVEVEGSYRLPSGVNPIRGLYFLSLPFLLDRNPFVQGLCSAHDMAEIAVSHLLAREGEDAPPDLACERDALTALRDGLRATRPSLFCLDSGLVVTR